MFNSAVHAQWTQTNGPFGGSCRAFATAADGSGGTNLFVATGAGVFRSTDNGTSWAGVNTGLTDWNALALAATPDGNGASHVFAGTADQGVFRSTNQGTSWEAVNTGLPRLTVFSLLANDANLFAGVYLNGVYRSTNAGTTWVAANAGMECFTPRTTAQAGNSSTRE